MEFKKAVKYEAKGRVCFIGPAGSGKSFSMLTLARLLVGEQGRIACIDTEHGSLSKYAHTHTCGGPGKCKEPDHFDFDVIELDSFSPSNFMAAIEMARKGKYDAFCCDSLSHFWVGKDGALEFVDMAQKRHRDGMRGWKEFRPHERAMVDVMLASPFHVITTMRTKTDYQEQVDPSTGKKKRVKVGLAPVQRDGLEYEFDLVGYMDDENTFIVDKSRCYHYAQKAFPKPSGKEFQIFKDWLKGTPRHPKPEVPANTPATGQLAQPPAPPPMAPTTQEPQNAYTMIHIQKVTRSASDGFKLWDIKGNTYLLQTESLAKQLKGLAGRTVPCEVRLVNQRLHVLSFKEARV